jgi:hypothetical protein
LPVALSLWPLARIGDHRLGEGLIARRKPLSTELSVLA